MRTYWKVTDSRSRVGNPQAPDSDAKPRGKKKKGGKKEKKKKKNKKLRKERPKKIVI